MFWSLIDTTFSRRLNFATKRGSDIFRQRILNTDEQRHFSILASAFWGGRVPAHQLLEARRPEDQGDDLWRVFNRVQENMIKGGVVGRSPTGRNTRTHGIRAMDNTVRVNQKLWEIAEELL